MYGQQEVRSVPARNETFPRRFVKILRKPLQVNHVETKEMILFSKMKTYYGSVIDFCLET